MRQAAVLLNVHEAFDIGFDIVYNGELVHLGPSAASENPADPESVEPIIAKEADDKEIADDDDEADE